MPHRMRGIRLRSDVSRAAIAGRLLRAVLRAGRIVAIFICRIVDKTHGVFESELQDCFEFPEKF